MMSEAWRHVGRGFVLAAVVWAFAGGADAEAQQAPPTQGGVRAGDQVRFRVHNMIDPRPVEATFAGWRGDTLVLELAHLEGTWLLATHQIRSLERYQALTPRHGLRRGMTLGLVIGVFVGAAAGGLLYATGVTHDEDGPPGEQLIGSVLRFSGLFTVGGAIAGGVLGGRNPGWGWVGIRLPSR